MASSTAFCYAAVLFLCVYLQNYCVTYGMHAMSPENIVCSVVLSAGIQHISVIIQTCAGIFSKFVR